MNIMCLCVDIDIPPVVAALLGIGTFGAAGATLAVSLRFGFEFDVAIDCCGNLSEAEN